MQKIKRLQSHTSVQKSKTTHDNRRLCGDKILFFAVNILVIFGIVMLYSASSYMAQRETGDAFFYVKKQIMAYAVGFALMILLSRVGADKVKKSSVWVYIVSLVLLALVFVPAISIEKYGARRWLNLGFITFQPSELAKFALVMLIAKFLSDKSTTKVRTMLPIFLVTAIVCVLIMMQPNMSITMCIGVVMMIMLFAGGTKFKHFAALAVPLAIGVFILIATEPYRLKRLMAFVNPWQNPLAEGYQLIQSYYALGSGGLFGVGLFNSRQKFLFLPFAESDFIFSIIGEELGLFGCLLFVSIFIIILWRGVKIALSASDRYSCYLAIGIVSIIAVQTALNIAVVSGSIPPTGLPLPFVSAGGSSLMIFMSGIGLLQSIARQNAVPLTQKMTKS